MADIIQRFDSVPAFMEQIKGSAYIVSGDSFYGRPTREAIQYVNRGATEREQEHVREVIDRVDASVERRGARVEASPVGSRVCVPDVLQGVPLAMRRRVHVVNEAAPVRVVLEPLVSGGVPVRVLRARGAACAALAMALAETRPVELYAAWSMRPIAHRGRNHDVIGMVKLDSAPINLAEVTAVLTTPEFARSVLFAHAASAVNRAFIPKLHWGWQMDPMNAGRTQRMRDTLNLDPDDIFIPGGYLSEMDQMISDPVAWVHKYLNAQREADQ